MTSPLQTTLYQILAVSEALIGFGILTLATTYILGVYNVLQQLGVVSAGLSTTRPRTGATLGASASRRTFRTVSIGT